MRTPPFREQDSQNEHFAVEIRSVCEEAARTRISLVNVARAAMIKLSSGPLKPYLSGGQLAGVAAWIQENKLLFLSVMDRQAVELGYTLSDPRGESLTRLYTARCLAAHIETVRNKYT